MATNTPNIHTIRFNQQDFNIKDSSALSTDDAKNIFQEKLPLGEIGQVLVQGEKKPEWKNIDVDIQPISKNFIDALCK